MSELYWLTTLGKLYNVFAGAALITGLSLAGSLIYYIAVITDGYDEEDYLKRFKRVIVILSVVCSLSTLASVFIPSAKELYAIYGIGSVIDYVESSDEAKKLPDNAVKALNHYLEKINDKDK